jgi:hypothetical protein
MESFNSKCHINACDNSGSELTWEACMTVQSTRSHVFRTKISVFHYSYSKLILILINYLRQILFAYIEDE